WLLTGQDHMFMEQVGLGNEDPRRQKYAELLGLMQVPSVEQAINAALTQIRATLELEGQNGEEEEE
ncbi:MAG: hypothetical protein GY950_19985, partial [bacterium]|nr:hypothetical protein [bacterium]